MKYSNIVIQQTNKITKEMGIPKNKLGQILYDDFENRERDYNVHIHRATRFLTNKTKINLEHIERLANFFNKPVEWFLGINTENTNQSHNTNSVVVGNNNSNTNINGMDRKTLIEQVLKLDRESQEVIFNLLKMMLGNDKQ